MDDLLAADRRFVAALAAHSPDAMTLLDSGLAWVDTHGARFGKHDTLPASPLGSEDGVVPRVERYAQAATVMAEQRRNNTPLAPAPLVDARLDAFVDTMLMRCEHQPFHGKAAYVSRLFVKRDGLWRMAASFQTARQDAPVKSI